MASFEDVELVNVTDIKPRVAESGVGRRGVGGRLVLPFSFDVCGLIRRLILREEISHMVLQSKYIEWWKLLQVDAAALGVTAPPPGRVEQVTACCTPA